MGVEPTTETFNNLYQSGKAQIVWTSLVSDLETPIRRFDFFFRLHDPTTRNQQHNDVGTQYRSAIFYATEEQRGTAERVKAQFAKSGRFQRPIVTEITQASVFYPAEEYHQKYLIKTPHGYNCHVLQD